MEKRWNKKFIIIKIKISNNLKYIKNIAVLKLLDLFYITLDYTIISKNRLGLSLNNQIKYIERSI
jgi:hypothetical protein